MSLGKGIAIAGIWLGAGLAMAFGHLSGGTVVGIAICAMIATISTS